MKKFTESDYAESAKQRLQADIYCCVSSLVSNLIPQAEHFPSYYDKLMECGSITSVADEQWRIHEMTDEREVHVVAVESVDQDDSEESYADSIRYQDYAEWLWLTKYVTVNEKQEWIDLYNAHLTKLYGGNAVGVTAFQPASIDDQEYLFEDTGCRPNCAEDLRLFLADARSGWWQTRWTLLDEGEDAETEDREVFGHWAIGSRLKSELESVGEKCVELFGLTVWCRTTTGQSFYYDGCMQTLGKRYLEEAEADAKRYGIIN